MKQKKKKNWTGILLLAIYGLIGGVCGFLFAQYALTDDLDAGQYFLRLFILMAGLYAIIFLHIALHEAGHLIFGLLTGYKFGSFRLGSLMLVRKNGHLRFRKFKLPGTAGQCLMVPPEPVNGRIAYVWYGLGGVIVNVVASLVALGAWLVLDKGTVPSLLLMMFWLFGIVLALVNGLPLPAGNVANDGKNTCTLKKYPKAMGGYIRQMQINAKLMEGLRLKEMSGSLFPVPALQDMDNIFTASEAVFAANRLLDEHRLEDTQQLLESVLQADTALLEIHRNVAVCDLIFCELVGQNRQEKVEALLTKEQKQFMKLMSKNISIQRTLYALAKLHHGDESAATKAMAQFEKLAKTYPYPQEVQGERELIAMVDHRATI